MFDTEKYFNIFFGGLGICLLIMASVVTLVVVKWGIQTLLGVI